MVMTPHGNRDMVTQRQALVYDQANRDRSFSAQQANQQQQMAQQQAILEQQMAMAQLQAATQQRGQDIGLQTAGSFQDRAGSQRELAQMAQQPQMRAMDLAERQYADQRSEGQLQRDMMEALRPQIMGAIQADGAPMPMDQAMAFASGDYGNYMNSQYERSQRDREMQMQQSMALASLAEQMGVEGSDLAGMLSGNLGASPEQMAMIEQAASRRPLEEELNSPAFQREMRQMARQAEGAKTSLPWLNWLENFGLDMGSSSFEDTQNKVNMELWSAAQQLASTTGKDVEDIYATLRQMLAEKIQPSEGIGNALVSGMGGFNVGGEMKRVYGEY